MNMYEYCEEKFNKLFEEIESEINDLEDLDRFYNFLIDLTGDCVLADKKTKDLYEAYENKMLDYIYKNNNNFKTKEEIIRNFCLVYDEPYERSIMIYNDLIRKNKIK